MAATGALLAAALALPACGTDRYHPPPNVQALQVVMKEKEAVPVKDRYGGAESCRPCHERIYRFWAGTGHAASMQSLSGKDGETSCLRCHVTGFGEQGGYGGVASPPGLASVSCEGCHGPAGSHADSADPGRDIPMLNSDCPPCEINRSCRFCHTGLWSPGFQLAPMLAKVSCRHGREMLRDSR